VTVRSTRPLASHGCAGTGGPSAPTTPTTTPPWWRLPPTSRPRPARRQRGRCSRTPSRTLCCARTTCWPSGRCGPSQRPDGVSRQTPPSSGWTTPTSPNSPHRRSPASASDCANAAPRRPPCCSTGSRNRAGRRLGSPSSPASCCASPASLGTRVLPSGLQSFPRTFAKGLCRSGVFVSRPGQIAPGGRHARRPPHPVGAVAASIRRANYPSLGTVTGVPATNLASATVSMLGAYAVALPSVNEPEPVVSVSGIDLSQKLFHE
jgi:hypothetical protein